MATPQTPHPDDVDIPTEEGPLREMIQQLTEEIQRLTAEIGDEAAIISGIDNTIEVPPRSYPVRGDVRYMDWKIIEDRAPNGYDVILMDPPWQLAGSAPSRGVGFQIPPQVDNPGHTELLTAAQQGNRGTSSEQAAIRRVSLHLGNQLSFRLCCQPDERMGLRASKQTLKDSNQSRLVDEIAWVKTTANRKLAKGHGFYLQHAKETCLVGWKGSKVDNKGLLSDVIFAQRRGQSQKPEELYTMIEELVPNGKYLEIFARRNNLRNDWVSIGMEL